MCIVHIIYIHQIYMHVYVYIEREREYITGGGARCFIPISPKDTQIFKMKTIQLPSTSLQCPHQHHQHPQLPPFPRKRTNVTNSLPTSNHYLSGNLLIFWGVTMASKLPQESQKKRHPDHPGFSSMPPLHFSVELPQVSAFFQA